MCLADVVDVARGRRHTARRICSGLPGGLDESGGAGVEGDEPHGVMIGPRGVSWALEGGTNTIVRVVPADAEATRREAH
jgi:ribosomal protein L15